MCTHCTTQPAATPHKASDVCLKQLSWIQVSFMLVSSVSTLYTKASILVKADRFNHRQQRCFISSFCHPSLYLSGISVSLG